jgi:hypothetical protein
MSQDFRVWVLEPVSKVLESYPSAAGYSVSMDCQNLRRRRLRWSEAQISACAPACRVGNRQTHRQRGRLQSCPPAMGDRTDVVLAPTQSTSDGSLRSVRPHRRRLRQARNDMYHAQAAH